MNESARRQVNRDVARQLNVVGDFVDSGREVYSTAPACAHVIDCSLNRGVHKRVASFIRIVRRGGDVEHAAADRRSVRLLGIPRNHHRFQRTGASADANDEVGGLALSDGKGQSRAADAAGDPEVVGTNVIARNRRTVSGRQSKLSALSRRFLEL